MPDEKRDSEGEEQSNDLWQQWAEVGEREVEKVKADIHGKYGFWATDEYCRDLIAFVYEISAEMMA